MSSKPGVRSAAADRTIGLKPEGLAPYAFAAYTKTLDVFDSMLARMMGATGDGLHVRLMEFSRAVTGAAFFVPSRETLSSLKQ